MKIRVPYQYLLGISVVLLIGAAVMATTVSKPSEGKPLNQVILEVNEVPITEPEFRLYMDKEKGAVTNDFSLTYGVGDSKTFWETEVDGKRPIDLLKERAMEEAVKGKLLQTLAHKHKIVDTVSFDGIRKEWEENNADRAQSLKQGKAIFGLARYDFSQYYFYYLSNMRLDLEASLGQGALSVTEEELSQAYEAHAAEYRGQTRLTVEEFIIPYMADNKDQARQSANEAKRMLESGATFRETSIRYAGGEPREESFVLGDSSSPLQAEEPLKQEASRLIEGEDSPIIDIGNGYSIIRLTKRDEAYSIPLSSVESQLRAEALQRKFDAYLEEQRRLSSIVVNRENYERLSPSVQ